MGLFTPAWMTNDRTKEEKAVKSVVRLSRQDELAKVALHAPLSEVRKAAVERLTDESVLFEIVKNDSDFLICQQAADKITNQNLLKELVLCKELRVARCSIIERLTNQELLEKFALEENWEDHGEIKWNTKTAIQCAAIKGLKSQDTLKKVFRECKDNSARQTAAELITDEAVLREAAYRDRDTNVRLAAAKKLGFSDMISELELALEAEKLKNIPNDKPKQNAKATINSISNVSVLIDLYTYAKSVEVRQYALDRLLKLNPPDGELIQLLLRHSVSTYDKNKIIPIINKDGLEELIKQIDGYTQDDDAQRTVIIALNCLKSFPNELFRIYSAFGKDSFTSEEAWKLLVKHHREFLYNKGLKEETDRTAAAIKSDSEAWQKHLDEVSRAIESYNDIGS